MSVTYEVYAYKAGKWSIDSVYDDREMALYEARLLLNSRYLSAVRVIEESYNDTTGDSATRIIFRQQKAGEVGTVKRRPPPRKKGERIRQPTQSKKKKKKMGTMTYLALMVGLIGAIGVGMIIALVYFIENVAEKAG